MKHNWEYKRLGDVATYVNGYAFKPTDWIESGYPIIRIQNLNNSDAIYNYSNGNIPSKYFVSDGDLLISWSASLGAYIWHGEKAVLNQHIFKVIFDKTDIIKNYLKYFVDFSLPLMASKTHGATMRHITKPSFDALPIPFPKLEVQEQIVAELDKINEVIADCRELLRNLDALAQALFYDYFGDPITNPKGWDIKPLKNAVIEMFLGPFGSALKTDCYVSKDNAFAMVYEQKHAIKKTLEQENHFINKEKFMSLKRFEVIPLDFIMSCRGTIGQLYQIPENSPRGIIHPSLMKIRLNSTTYNPAFFKFLLPIIIKEQQTKGNCVQMAITAKELGSKKLPVPPLALQEKFAARIEQIEEQKKSVEQTIAELQTLLDSRMDYWFN